MTQPIGVHVAFVEMVRDGARGRDIDKAAAELKALASGTPEVISAGRRSLFVGLRTSLPMLGTQRGISNCARRG